jgi:hypothetical protein
MPRGGLTLALGLQKCKSYVFRAEGVYRNVAQHAGRAVLETV